ncbi:MAG TPA: cation-translocating P-type ATPase [Bacteroidia bacterium]|nr:cation-translocating P-type ATPase [Bacteroidia bacterium]
MEEAINGLNNREVIASRKLHGTNLLPSGRKKWVNVLLETIAEPMLLLLTGACVIYFITGSFQEGVIMAIAIVFVSGISIFQQIRSEKAVSALNKLTSRHSRVYRNGQTENVLSEELVCDDILLVSEGESIPADGLVISCNDFSVDESLLTGESFPVLKVPGESSVYSGTTIVSGGATVKITEVGIHTRIGKLGVSMTEIKTGDTPLQVQVKTFVRQMALFGIIAFIFVWTFNYIATGDALSGFMRGLTLAMAALPEEIPVALSTFMALGAYHLIRTNVLARHPQTVEALGAATVICVDKTGTITKNQMSVVAVYLYDSDQTFNMMSSSADSKTSDILLAAALASEKDPFDPMEKAIFDCARKAGLTTSEYTMTSEYPLSGDRPMMTHIYSSPDNKRIIVAKGAPEGIMECSGMNDAERSGVEAHVKEFAKQGYRVLGVAQSEHKGELPKQQQDIKFKFIGLVAFSDPPKENIPAVVDAFHKAGISVKLITGDYPETAVAIAKQVGISDNGDFISGNQLALMSDAQLSESVKEINVFARVLPEAKLRIVNILKGNGEVVAMTGDGVNDGPALKAAHIGIAMGQRGSEVARQAASLVLVNDDLSNMIAAVGLGRKIYYNLKKAIRYIISIHIPLISIVTLPLVLGWKFPNLFSPVHVIFLELIMGPTCSIVYENEPMEQGLMHAAPRKMTSTFFTWRELSTSIFQGLMITAMLLILLHYAILHDYSEASSRTLVFSALVLSNIFLTLTGRSEVHNIFTTIRYKNLLVPIIILFTSAVLFILLVYPPAAELFGLLTPSVKDFILAAVASFASVFWIEVIKKPSQEKLQV